VVRRHEVTRRRAAAGPTSTLDRLCSASVDAWTTAAERDHLSQLVARWHEPAAARELYEAAPRCRPCLLVGGPWTPGRRLTRARARELLAEVLASVVDDRRRAACREEADRRGMRAHDLAQAVGLSWC
jgi:hypothetical protein